MVIDDVNGKQSHFESVLRAGGSIAGPKLECGESNTKLMAIYMHGYKQNVGQGEPDIHT